MIGQLVAFDYPSTCRLFPFGMQYRDLLDYFLDFSGRGSIGHHPCSSMNFDDVFLRHLLPRRSYTSRRISNRRKNLEAVEKKNEEDERQEPPVEEKFFRVSLDVSHFRPEELTVKTTGNKLIVHGKHEQKQDEQGYVKRQFKRTYLLPEDVDPDKVTSTLTSSGLLSIKAPKKMAIESTPEIRVPIDLEPVTSVGHGSSEGQWSSKDQEPCETRGSSEGLEPCEDQGSLEG